ncbi:hypothetical protein RQP46_007307 [Phenoliferia psychrophenolica]
MDGADEDAAAAANPFDALLSATHDDPTAIEAAYALHRSTRAAQQRVLLLSPDFPGLAIDPIFQRIVAEEKGFKDDRGGIVLAAKPPPRIQHLVARIQDRLEGVLRGQWFAPPSYLHLTLLEVTHSTLPPALSFLLTSPLLLRTLSLLTSHPSTLPSTLHSPQLNLDSTALSLSFLPLPSTSSHVTYHHLRQSLFSLYTTSQVSPPLNARYVVPSIHITLLIIAAPPLLLSNQTTMSLLLGPDLHI